MKPQFHPQSTDEWRKARLGRVTASRVSSVMARTKFGSWGATRDNYMAELISERLTGAPVEHFVSAAMQWGKDTEAEALAAYEFSTDRDVGLVGFVQHPSIKMAGASPDGTVGEDGLIEIKCPNTATHIDSLLGVPWPEKYMMQVQWQMACAGRQWCDLCSYDPRMPEAMRLLVRRIPPNDALIIALEQNVVTLLERHDDKVAKLAARYLSKAAA